jgi:hypothetical protein
MRLTLLLPQYQTGIPLTMQLFFASKMALSFFYTAILLGLVVLRVLFISCRNCVNQWESRKNTSV